MSKFTGNIIRLPAVTPTQNSASGVYTLDDQFTAQSSGTWPIVRDQYFNYTTLLLTGAVQGTAYPNPVTQPYSFLSDASTNNFVVSPNGDVSARPFNPYLNNYSNYFGGSPSYLSGSGQLLGVGSNNFTVEAWIFLPSFGATYQIIGTSTTSSSPTGIYFGINPSGALFAAETWGINVWTTTGLTFSAGTWNHVALCRSGTTARIFLNGIQASNTGTFNESYNSTLFVVGRTWTTDAANSNYMVGNISNLRVISGQALYSGNFTPPALPFTATTVGSTGSGAATSITGTVTLLTCQDNRFKDNSPSNRTITANGTPAVSQNSPFVSYDTTNGSGYFDGTNDNLMVADATALDLGLGNFTIECWIYLAGGSGTFRQFFSKYTGGVGIEWYVSNANKLEVYFNGGAGQITSTGTINTNTWYHVALVRSGTGAAQTKFYINGSEDGSNQVNLNLDNAGALYIGESGAASNDYLGYICDMRVIKGTAVYTGNFTPPIAPIRTSGAASAASYPSTTNVNTSFAESATSLLTLQTRAPATNNGFIDSSPNNFVVTRNGNTTQGSFSPFSPTGWGNYFSGSSTYLQTPSSSAFDFGSNSFTIEAFIYLTSATTGTIIGTRTGDTSSTIRWVFYTTSAGNLECDIWNTSNSRIAVVTHQTALQLNAWQHVALVRNGSDFRLYLNGVQSTSNATSSTAVNNSILSPTIAQSLGGFGGTNGPLVGYLSNLRVIKDQALYTGNFTPPTAALTTTSVGTSGTNVATSLTGSVSLLTCQSNRFKDNSPNNFTLTVNGSPSVQAFSPFAPAQSYIPSQIGGSGYFDGTGDYLTVPDNAAFNLAGGSWTIEGWFYLTSDYSNYRPLVTKRSGGTNSYQIYANITNGYLSFYANSIYNSTTAMPRNTWCHIAAVYDGTNIVLYLNGTSILNQAATITNQAVNLLIGSSSVSGEEFGGYISNVRVVKGTAVYTSNFTPPTAPLTAIPNTSLLLNFTNGGIVDATGKNNLETVANSGVQTSIINPFGSRTGLMYFNGSSYFYEPYTQLMNQLNGNFTIECWIYPTVTSTRMLFAGSTNAAGLTNWYFEITAANKLQFNWTNTVPTSFIPASTASITPNVWTYVAVVKNGGTMTLYINGSADGSANPTGTYANSAYPFALGRAGDYNGLYYTGYISNFRMTIGQARTITSSPTGPFPLG